eukprot:jgi/Bigna1/39796/e_gw1.36.28.1
MLDFTKMNGAGNDFVVIDNRDESITLSKEEIAQLCDRHRGIGADGLLAVEPAESGADYKFRYYNADGSEAEMCGNGARCFGAFAARLSSPTKEVVTFESIAGTLSAELIGGSTNVRIAMCDPFDLHMNLKTDLKSDLLGDIHFVNTGVPHAVTFVSGDLPGIDVIESGAAIRHHGHFAPKGTNVNFAKVISRGHVAIRTYERGVEGETLACGTGVCACALIHHVLTDEPSPIKVNVAGGDTLQVGFRPLGDGKFKELTLTGPADFVFSGSIKVKRALP